MSKNGGKSAKSAAFTAETVVFISGKIWLFSPSDGKNWWSLTG
jgi:hypothetical protein